MDNKDILLDTIKGFIPEELWDNISLESSFIEDFKFDSVSLLGLFITLEHELDINFSNAPVKYNLAEIKRVIDLLNWINSIKKD